MIIDCLCHLYVLTEFAHFVYKHVLLICYVCNLLCLVIGFDVEGFCLSFSFVQWFSNFLIPRPPIVHNIQRLHDFSSFSWFSLCIKDKDL